jgi:hypothetical protein
MKNPGLTFAQQFGCTSPDEAIKQGKTTILEWCAWVQDNRPKVIPPKKHSDLEGRVMELLEENDGADGVEIAKSLRVHGAALNQVLNRLGHRGVLRRERVHPDKPFPVRNWLVPE